jgi:O-antigen/teichoic acid export membrane protein
MKHHLRTLSASTFQMVVNQVFGLLFFLGMAVLLPKALFGQVNWAIAVCATITIISSLGFDHIIVRKLSAGSRVGDTVSIYLAHTFIIAAIAMLGLLAHRAIDPEFHRSNSTFSTIFIGLLATFLSMPYKQLANGKERFWHLAFMGISGNVIRVIILCLLYFTHRITADNIGWMFLAGGMLEWIACGLLGLQLSGRMLWPVWNFTKYTLLVKEALPQMGVILLDSAFARVDWILMGILSTDAFMADYSFGYKAFESSRLPLLIIAPVILPKISRLYSKGGITDSAASGLNSLWRVESLICVLIPLILNVCWVDLVNLVTQGRYGLSTQWVYAVLSLSLPMAYIINFMWTIAFAQGRLKMIFQFTAITLCCNVVLNLTLIPLLGALGAAIAFTGSTAVQLVLYTSKVRETTLRIPFSDFIKAVTAAAVLSFGTAMLPLHWLIKVPVALCAFVLVARLTGMIQWSKPFILYKKQA